MEPIYLVEILCLATYGRRYERYSNRRGMIEGMSSKKGFQVLRARVPLAELYRYSTTLSSLTSGRATFTQEFVEYQQVPADIQEKLLKNTKQRLRKKTSDYSRPYQKSFGTLVVLKDICFQADAAEVVSIVGASGAGKSTLLHIIGTLSKPDSGRVIIDGTDVLSLSDKELAHFRNTRIGFVFQAHHLLPEFTALENVMIPALIAGKSRKAASSEAMELLSQLGLGERAHHKPSELSGGEQQRVAIARALVNRPAVLFADEPSGNLDSKNKGELHRLFFDLRDRYGITIIIVTHDKELAALSDRTLEMKDGSLSDSRMSTFRFKRFSLSNEKSAMKVNTDGVLLGAWVDLQQNSEHFQSPCKCWISVQVRES